MSHPQRPGTTAGMHHVALFVTKFDACVDFYTRVLGMAVEWHPDEDNIYLSSGSDNVAIHRATHHPQTGDGQRLDHIGFIIDRKDDVDAWHGYFLTEGIEILQGPKTHRDGARSFYCKDPDGTTVQMIFHPPLSTG
jgi:catechol 2,3-dioxygenase-like lactoylglutathione lyase family enzyme